MKFTMTVHWVLQAVAMIAQFGNIELHVLPPEYQHGFTVVISVCQLVMAMKAHTVNQDGTPSTQPYVPPKKADQEED